MTVGEFAGALEKVLRGFGLEIRTGAIQSEVPGVIETDLGLFAQEFGENVELFFYPRLRDELRFQLRHTPRLLRFRGLRGCAKQLAGARRWSHRCEKIQEQIVEYLRGCLSADKEQNDCALVVE